MLHRIFFMGVCSVFIFSTSAQSLVGAYAERMKNLYPEKTSIDLFVRGEVDEVKKAVLAAEGNFKYGYGRYSSVSIPLKTLDAFLANPAIRGVQNGEVRLVPMCDTAIIVNCVKPVHEGEAPLDRPYTGDGVIMGVIDYGIDINHADFRKSNGDTRIRYLWDQRAQNVNSPLPYNYGRQWNEFEINAGQCTHDENVLVSASHGTTVAGIAAGNGRACNSRYVGMAPNTDLIIVAISYQAAFLSRFVDAVDYIFKKADAMGKPCVINASFGIYGGYQAGSHDGKDFASHIIDELLEERNGRVLVCAAGNAGGLPFHLGYDVTEDTSFTWFSYSSTNNDPYASFDFWADTQDFNNVYFAVGLDNPVNCQKVARSQFYNIPRDYRFQNVQGDTLAFLDFSLADANNAFLAAVSTVIWLTEGRYNINIKANGVTNTSLYWSFITTGSGRVDGWNSSQLGIDHYNMVSPPPGFCPDLTNYKYPDYNMNMAASFSCSGKVITVGNFINRGHYPDCDSNLVYTSAVPGMIGPSSSRGPTRDGRIKPDITATGDFTMASGHASQVAISMGNQDRYKVGYCCKYFRNGGTSMASPAVAGIAALYLQRHPDAGWKEVKQAIINTAKVDSFTGAVPNNIYGYGKVQACAAMLSIRGCTDTAAFNYNANATVDDGSCIPKIYGCTDSTAFNYNPDANMEDGSCQPKVYGCTDSTAFNYNPDANVDDGSCEPVILGCTDSAAINYYPQANTDDGSCQYVGITIAPAQTVKFAFVPNFFKEQSRVVYDLGKPVGGKVSVLIFNLLGQKVDEIELKEAKGDMLYRFPSKVSGIFFYRLMNDGKPLLSGKIAIG